jgi:hypothetical protein
MAVVPEKTDGPHENFVRNEQVVTDVLQLHGHHREVQAKQRRDADNDDRLRAVASESVLQNDERGNRHRHKC